MGIQWNRQEDSEAVRREQEQRVQTQCKVIHVSHVRQFHLDELEKSLNKSPSSQKIVIIGLDQMDALESQQAVLQQLEKISAKKPVEVIHHQEIASLMTLDVDKIKLYHDQKRNPDSGMDPNGSKPKPSGPR